jgi:hypothetical protein
MAENMASRSLGSNQVSLGRHDGAGIGNRHQIPDARGEREKAQAYSPLSTRRSARRYPECAHKADLVAGPGVRDAEQRFQDVLLQEAHVEPVRRGLAGDPFGAEAQGVPGFAEVEAEGVGLAGNGLAGLCTSKTS